MRLIVVQLLATALIVVVAGLRAAFAGTPAVDAGPSAPYEWRALHFSGSALLADFEAALELWEQAPAEPGPWIAELRTQMRSLLLPDKETRVRAWFDPVTGAVARFDKLTLGPGPNFKRYRFREGGVQRTRREPLRTEEGQDYTAWSDERESFHRFDAAKHGCKVLSDPATLVYLVTWGPGSWARDPAACVFWGKTLYRLTLRPVDTLIHDISYRISGDVPHRRHARVEALRYDLVARPVAGNLEEEVTRLEILVDSGTGIPWRVVTREGPFAIDMELREVVLRNPQLGTVPGWQGRLASGSSRARSSETTPSSGSSPRR